MAQVVVTSEGLGELAANMLTAASIPDSGYYLVDLYQNNYTPTFDATPGDFVICDFVGYSQVTFSRSQLELHVLLAQYLTATYANNPISWSNNQNSTAVIYGYLVRSSQTGNVLWCQLFDQVQFLTPNQVLNLDLVLNVFPNVSYSPPPPPGA